MNEPKTIHPIVINDNKAMLVQMTALRLAGLAVGAGNLSLTKKM